MESDAEGGLSALTVKTRRLLVWNARLIAPAPDASPCFLGWLLVGFDGRIANVEAGTPPMDAAAEWEVDARGACMAPGFISVHGMIGNKGYHKEAVEEGLLPQAGERPFSVSKRRPWPRCGRA